MDFATPFIISGQAKRSRNVELRSAWRAATADDLVCRSVPPEGGTTNEEGDEEAGDENSNACLAADAFDLVAEVFQFGDDALALIALNFDAAVFHRTAGAAALFEYRG